MNSKLASSRIDVVDVLRSFAIMGIVLLHCVEHYRFTGYVDVVSQYAFVNFLDTLVWDSMHFIFSNKSYAIFSLLFGFSFYIQYHNQQLKGRDFRLRFCWRLAILFVIGLINSAFYPADILVIYSILGFILPTVVGMSNKVLLIAAGVLMIQPQMLFFLAKTLIDPGYVVPSLQLEPDFIPISDAIQHGSSFIETAKYHIFNGELNMIQWSTNSGRINQTIAFFILGLIIGRKSLFLQENISIWYKLLVLAPFVYFPFSGLKAVIPDFVTNGQALDLLVSYLSFWTNMSIAVALVSAIVILFYTTGLRSVMMKFTPFGKMSLTNYVTQSMIGSFLFFGWGLALAFKIGYTLSLCVGVLIFVVQLYFSRWYLSRYKQGPLETLWRKATWLKSK